MTELPQETDNPLKECQFDTQSQCPYTLEDTAPEDSMSTEASLCFDFHIKFLIFKSSMTNHDSDPECEHNQKSKVTKEKKLSPSNSVQEESF